MFSQGLQETELRYEKELTECMRRHGTIRKGEWGYEYTTDQADEKKWKLLEKNMEVNDGCCYGIVNEKAFIWVHDAEKKYGRVGCYDLKSGMFWWLADHDKEYYELCYDKRQDSSEYYEYTPEDPPCFPFYGIVDGDQRMKGENFMRRKKNKVMLSIFLVAAILSGCGGEFDAGSHENSENISGAAVSVSGQAVSGPAVFTKEDAEQYPYCNAAQLYYCDYTNDGECILVEHNLEDSSEHKIKLKNLFKVCFVDNDWVYYLKWKEPGDADQHTNDYSQLWRAPVKKDGLDVRDEELIFTEKDGVHIVDKYSCSWESSYCDGHYMLYVTDQNRTFKMYDLKKREYVELRGRTCFDYSMISKVCGETVFISFYTTEEEDGEGEGLYRLDLGSEELFKIKDERVFEFDSIGTDTDLFYQEAFDENTNIWQYHIEDNSKKKIITSDQLKKRLVEENLMDFSKGTDHLYYVSNMLIRKGDLYCQVSLSWREDKIEYQRYVMFRMGLEDPDQLYYEKELSDALKNPVENQKPFDKTYVPVYSDLSRENVLFLSLGGVLWMTEEKAYCVLYNTKEDQNMLGCYDFSSGEMKYMTKADPEYYEMLFKYGTVLDNEYIFWQSFLPNNKLELEVN